MVSKEALISTIVMRWDRFIIIVLFLRNLGVLVIVLIHMPLKISQNS